MTVRGYTPLDGSRRIYSPGWEQGNKFPCMGTGEYTPLDGSRRIYSPGWEQGNIFPWMGAAGCIPLDESKGMNIFPKVIHTWINPYGQSK
jgi:hypothetical protein